MANPQPKTDMKAIYASLESETIVSSPSLSEETNKAIKMLRYLMSEDFPDLFHPIRSTVMKDTLNYLLSLPPSAIKQIFQRFTELTTNYNAESTKGVEKMRNELDANVKEFRENENKDKLYNSQLARWEKEKTKLEEKINVLKIQIENFAELRDMVAKRKRKLFDEETVLKARRDELLKQSGLVDEINSLEEQVLKYGFNSNES